MAILSKFGAQTIKINIADNIQSGSAGVMGDFNSRTLKVSINAENGEVLEDPSIKAKLLCKTEGDELIFTEGEYVGEGIYQVDFPNEVFEQEQELECIIQLSKEDEILYSRIFKRRVERGLLGTEREGTSTIIDLLKIMDFADNYEEKLKEMEELGNKEEAEIIAKALELTETFNANAEEKTDAFNENTTEKTDTFNANAAEKTEIVDNIKEEVEGLKDITVAAKDTTLDTKEKFDGEYTDFNNRYTDIQGILEAEEDRVEAENARQDFDERLQKIFDEGLDSELGNYYTKPETDAKLEKKVNVKTLDKYEAENFIEGSSPDYKEVYSSHYSIIGKIYGSDLLLANTKKTLIRLELKSEELKYNGNLKIIVRIGTNTGEVASAVHYLWDEMKGTKEKAYTFGVTMSRTPREGEEFYVQVKIFNTAEIDLTGKLFYKKARITFNGEKVNWKMSNRDFALKTDVVGLRKDLEEESASNREEFAKINKSLAAITELLSGIINITRDTNKKVDDSNRNYKALLESDKDLIG